MRKNALYTSIFITLLFAVFCWGIECSPVHAQTLSQNINKQIGVAASSSGIMTTSTPGQYIASFISVILSVTGMTFLVLLIFAGYVRMTAHGEEDRLKKSTRIAVAALLGLTIVLLAYAITRFVLPRVYNATTQDPRYEINNQSPNTTYEQSIDIHLF